MSFSVAARGGAQTSVLFLRKRLGRKRWTKLLRHPKAMAGKMVVGRKRRAPVNCRLAIQGKQRGNKGQKRKWGAPSSLK